MNSLPQPFAISQAIAQNVLSSPPHRPPRSPLLHLPPLASPHSSRPTKLSALTPRISLYWTSFLPVTKLSPGLFLSVQPTAPRGVAVRASSSEDDKKDDSTPRSVFLLLSLLFGIAVPTFKFQDFFLGLFSKDTNVLEKLEENVDKAAKVVKESAVIVEEVAESVEKVSKVIAEETENAEAVLGKSSMAGGVLEKIVQNVDKASKELAEDADKVEALADEVEEASESVQKSVDEVLDKLEGAMENATKEQSSATSTEKYEGKKDLS